MKYKDNVYNIYPGKVTSFLFLLVAFFPLWSLLLVALILK